MENSYREPFEKGSSSLYIAVLFVANCITLGKPIKSLYHINKVVIKDYKMKRNKKENKKINRKKEENKRKKMAGKWLD